MPQSKSIFPASLHLSRRLLTKKWPTLLLLFVASAAITMSFEDVILTLGPTEDTLRIVVAAGSGIFSLVEGFLLLLILSWTLPSVHPLTGPAFLNQPFHKPYLSSFFAEYLRALGSVLAWGILLLIPGFVRYVYLIFVPLVVFFSRDYDNEKVDALALSTKLAGQRFGLLFTFTLGTIVFSLILQLAPGSDAAFRLFPIRVAFHFVEFLIGIWSFSLVALVFEQEMTKRGVLHDE